MSARSRLTAPAAFAPLLVLALAAGLLPGTPAPAVAAGGSADVATIAVVGDFGYANAAEASVASMVAGWAPDAVLATGDDYYSTVGGSGTGKYDITVGKYYCRFLRGAAAGTNCPSGGTADVNRFFSSTGNHDYSDGLIANYTAYFALPGTELVYSQVVGDVEFFFIDSQA